jgi:hypothetical protein
MSTSPAASHVGNPVVDACPERGRPARVHVLAAPTWRIGQAGLTPPGCRRTLRLPGGPTRLDTPDESKRGAAHRWPRVDFLQSLPMCHPSGSH